MRDPSTPGRRPDSAFLASLTPLERFIVRNEIKPAHLATASGCSRQHLLRIRRGRMEPTRRCIAAIVAGMRTLTRRNLTALDLFQFDDGPLAGTYRRPGDGEAVSSP
jgi:hypothetical protein